MVSTAGGIVIAIVVLLLAAAIGWIVFTQLRARRLGVRASVSHLPLATWFQWHSRSGFAPPPDFACLVVKSASIGRS